MFSNSRTSLLGLRVAALKQGAFTPGTIQTFKSFGCIPEEDVYIVKFDDNSEAECSAKNMIGTNFKPMHGIWMQPFQKVCTTHNGREVSGYIQRYQDDQFFISIPGASEEIEVISKKPDEVRLIDSRRNQRVPNSSPVNHGRQTEDDSVTYGRTVSASIEVPKPSERIRRTSEEPTMNELMAAMVLSSLSCSPVFYNQPKAESSPRSYDSSGVESWTHDSKHTSPSRHSSLVNTPAGAQALESELKDDGIASDYQRSRTPEDTLETDSGMILLQGSASTPTKSNPTKNEVMEEECSDEPQDLSVPKVRVEEASTPRPRSRSSQIPPSFSDVTKLDVVMEHEEQQKTEPQPAITMAMPITIPQIPLSYYVPSAALYQSQFFGSLPAEFRLHLPGTPPVRSPEIGSSAPGVMDSKLHRYSHRAVPYQKFSDDSAVASPSSGSSPSTQQIYGSAPATYYHLPNSPIPVSSLSFSPSHHRKHTKSPLASKPQASPLPSSKITHSTPVSVPTSVTRGYPILQSIPYANPASDHAMPKAFSWHNTASPAAFLSKPVQPRPQLYPASSKPGAAMPSKSIPAGRKVRGDGKKCRKVYGMDHRDMWCTACRWKKACQRFPD